MARKRERTSGRGAQTRLLIWKESSLKGGKGAGRARVDHGEKLRSRDRRLWRVDMRKNKWEKQRIGRQFWNQGRKVRMRDRGQGR